ncbi:transposase [Streptacidiphilus griseoplanus]|uniref:transposase n=1 Tax=Peterkaempfera griseoplana TaxID=66896 RepID=UPI000ADAFCD9|nr:transposase [Peterkaempfera griseoplana]
MDLLAGEDQPVDVFGCTAYFTGVTRHALARAGHRLFLKPAPLRAAVPGGFTLDDFAVNTAGNTVSCPAGHTADLAQPRGRHNQRAASYSDLCTGCPLRARCTKAKAGRAAAPQVRAFGADPVVLGRTGCPPTASASSPIHVTVVVSGVGPVLDLLQAALDGPGHLVEVDGRGIPLKVITVVAETEGGHRVTSCGQ